MIGKFDNLDTEQKVYWLGFLFADGSLIKYGPSYYRISVTLSSKDAKHLSKLALFLDVKMHHYDVLNKQVDKIYKRVVLHDTRKEDYEYIRSLGFVQRKSSKNLYIPNVIPSNMVHHFIRGYFDGDGSVCIRKSGKQKGQKRFEIVAGHPAILEDIAGILRPIAGAKLRIYKQNPHKCWAIETSGRKCKPIYNYLYKDATIYLERKKEIFESI